MGPMTDIENTCRSPFREAVFFLEVSLVWKPFTIFFPTGLLSVVLGLPSAHAGSYDLHRVLETQGKCEHFTPLGK